MPPSQDVNFRFYQPSARLRRYFSTFVLNEVTLPPGETISDFLMPSWGIVGVSSGGHCTVEYTSGRTFSGGHSTVTGPFCRAARMTLGSSRRWGLGLLPMGWARFIHAPAVNYANMTVDAESHPALAAFHGFNKAVFGDKPDCDGERARIESCLDERLNEPSRGEIIEDRVEAIFDALQDKSVAKVTELAERANMNLRTLERLCNRAYGFPPKTLLRRQRFLRSMTHHSLGPSGTWTDAMDDGYHDQSQFVREFRQFMGVSPTEYASIARPLSTPLVKERAHYALAADRQPGRGQT